MTDYSKPTYDLDEYIITHGNGIIRDALRVALDKLDAAQAEYDHLAEMYYAAMRDLEELRKEIP